MDVSSVSKICQTHKQQCLGVDINPFCDLESRHCCEFCLNIPKEFREFVTYKNALLCLENTKSELLQKRENQFKCNIDSLKNTINCISSLKSELIKGLEDAIDQINQQMATMQKLFEQNQQFYGNLDLDSFFQLKMDNKEEIHNQKFSLNIKAHLMKIFSNEKIDPSLQSLSQLDISTTSIGRIESASYNSNELKQNIQMLSLKCSVHNKSIKAFDLNPNVAREARIICEECFDNRSGPFTSFQKIQEKWQDYSNFHQECINVGQNTSQIKDLLVNCIEKFQINYCEEFEKFLENLKSKHSNFVDKHQVEIRMISRKWETLKAHEIFERIETLSNKSLNVTFQQMYLRESENISSEYIESTKSLLQRLKQIKEQVMQEVIDSLTKATSGKIQIQFQKNVSIQAFSTLGSKILVSSCFQKKKGVLSKKLNIFSFTNEPRPRKPVLSINLPSQLPEFFRKNPPINFKPRLTYQQKETCYAIAVNSQQNKVVAGCNQLIRAFELKNGNLIFKQNLQGHKKIITALVFLKKSDRFVSADKSIIVWVWSEVGWRSDWIKNLAHSKRTLCLQIFDDDNYMASCSKDSYMKIWKRLDENTWQVFQCFQVDGVQLYSMSVNFTQSLIVVCGYLGGFNVSAGTLIFYKCVAKQWEQVDQKYFFYFTNNITFAENSNHLIFQCTKEGIMNIYQNNDITQKYENMIDKKLIVNEYDDHDYDQFPFHQIYSSKNRILVHRHGKFLYLIRNLSNGRFYIEQKINFKTNQIFGTLSPDGNFLIAWDSSEKELKVYQTD